jgi:hypothetical protein
MVNSHLLCQLSYWGLIASYKSLYSQFHSQQNPMVNPATGGTLPIPLPAGLLGIKINVLNNKNKMPSQVKTQYGVL